MGESVLSNGVDSFQYFTKLNFKILIFFQLSQSWKLKS